MVRWHQWLKGHESEQAPRDGEGQGSLACRSLWGRKEWDTTEWLNNKILRAHTHTNTSSLPVTPPRWLITHIRVPVHGVMKKQGGGGWGQGPAGDTANDHRQAGLLLALPGRARVCRWWGRGPEEGCQGLAGLQAHAGPDELGRQTFSLFLNRNKRMKSLASMEHIQCRLLTCHCCEDERNIINKTHPDSLLCLP